MTVKNQIFDIDIFISYAHIDDAGLIPGEPGWISVFHHAFEAKLQMIMGERVKIWRDEQRLEGTDMFAEKIVSQFSRTALMISILTPRYVKSEWCIKELDEFSRIANTNIGLQVGEKLRVVKVIKTPIDHTKHPKIIADTLGFEFYGTDSVRKRYFDLTLRGHRNEYESLLEDLAWEVKATLEKVRLAEQAYIFGEKEFVNLPHTKNKLVNQQEGGDTTKKQLLKQENI